MVAICPTTPPDNCHKNEIENYNQEVKMISTELSFSRGTKLDAESAGKIRKNLFDEKI
jgi:hypothetical protein